jgi:hypothetical protein
MARTWQQKQKDKLTKSYGRKRGMRVALPPVAPGRTTRKRIVKTTASISPSQRRTRQAKSTVSATKASGPNWKKIASESPQRRKYSPAPARKRVRKPTRARRGESQGLGNWDGYVTLTALAKESYPRSPQRRKRKVVATKSSRSALSPAQRKAKLKTTAGIQNPLKKPTLGIIRTASMGSPPAKPRMPRAKTDSLKGWGKARTTGSKVKAAPKSKRKTYGTPSLKKRPYRGVGGSSVTMAWGRAKRKRSVNSLLRQAGTGRI